MKNDGILVRNQGTIFSRNVAVGSNKLSIINADGVSGNPTLDVVEANLSIGGFSGVLTMDKGGTGLSSFTQGDLLYYNSGISLSQLAKSTTANSFLKNSGSNNNPAWATIASTDLSDTSSIGRHTDKLSAFAATSSAELAGIISDETGSAGKLVFSTSPVLTTPTIVTSIRPDSNDGATLGDATHNFSDLFLATGAIINYNNGNWIATHTAGILTIGTGTLKITTPTNDATSVVTIDGTQTLTNKTLTSPFVNEAVALTTTATKLNYITSAGGTTGTTSTNIVFSTSPTIVTPTITTSLTGPLIIGGTGTTSTLSLRSTSGVGTTGADIIFQAGDNGSTEIMRLLNNATIGIGNSSPVVRLGQKIDISVSNNYGGICFNTWSATGTHAAVIDIQKSKNNTIGSHTIGADSDRVGFFIFRHSDGTNFIETASIRAEIDGTPGNNDMPGRLLFLTTADGASSVTERMRITSSGYVGIGCTPSYQLQVNTDSAGKPGAGGLWTVVSDEKIKDNIVLADLDRCYEIVKTLPLKHFKFKDSCYTEKQVKDRSALGWIAQDVKPIFPKAVNKIDFVCKEEIKDADGNITQEKEIIPNCLDLNSGQIIAAMYGAIQKMQIILEKHEEKLK